MSGGDLRWKIACAVLNLAKVHLAVMYEMPKWKQFIEKIPTDEALPYVYPHFRLLDRKPYLDLCNKICQDILNGEGVDFRLKLNGLSYYEIMPLYSFVLTKKITDETTEQCSQIFGKNSNLLDILLILRGILAYDVLFTVLSKRWRVDYGINLKNNRLYQAVPFR